MAYWRGNKYKNIPKEYGGRTYHSTLESQYAAYLDLLKKCKEIQEWKGQVTYRLDVNGHHICNIIPDFWVLGKHGREEVHETKSWATMTPEWRIKSKLFKALYPDIEYIVIKKGDF